MLITCGANAERDNVNLIFMFNHSLAPDDHRSSRIARMTTRGIAHSSRGDAQGWYSTTSSDNCVCPALRPPRLAVLLHPGALVHKALPMARQQPSYLLAAARVVLLHERELLVVRPSHLLVVIKRVVEDREDTFWWDRVWGVSEHRTQHVAPRGELAVVALPPRMKVERVLALSVLAARQRRDLTYLCE
eukprot:2086133-Prymnesium_polylepis.1